MSEDKPGVPNLTYEELQNELQTWSMQHGDYEEKKGNGLPFYRIKHYPTAMNALVLRFIEIGYDEKQIRGQVNSTQIQNHCTSYKHPNKENWKRVIKNYWDFAVNQRFPATDKVTEAQPIEQDRATVQLETPVSTAKKAETLDMTKHVGFGAPLRKQTEENLLAGLDDE